MAATATLDMNTQTALWQQQQQQADDWTSDQRSIFDQQVRAYKSTLSDQPHPERDEIIRQVEFYFGDENLPQDAHLLSKTGEYGDDWVSINEVLGFRKMRRFKPRSRVIAALKESTKLEIYHNRKYIRRKEPLQVPLRVKPKQDPKRDQIKELIDKPWLTKGMQKPTGFEANYAEPPLKPEEYEDERRLFDPEESFAVRIENAVTRYTSRRKFHQNTQQIFSKFLLFGGFNANSHMFVGKKSERDFEDMDKDQINDMMAQFSLHESVWDGLDPEEGEPTWEVDFATVVKAFLSSPFMASFTWKNPEIVSNATNVLRNFYAYLMHHDVCPEYNDQIQAAINVCYRAEEEFIKLNKLDAALPGDFNIACSTIHEGHYFEIRPLNPDADWLLPEDKVGMPDKDARAIYLAGTLAHGTDDQVSKLIESTQTGIRLSVTSTEQLGLEVLRIESATSRAKEIYADPRLQSSIVKPSGTLICRRWQVPHAPPRDLPQEMIDEIKSKKNEIFTFIVEDELLQFCFPGLKMEAVVMELSGGLKWLDMVVHVYPSFYKWTQNENWREVRKEEEPPKKWMLKQMGKGGEVEGGEVVENGDGKVGEIEGGAAVKSEDEVAAEMMELGDKLRAAGQES